MTIERENRLLLIVEALKRGGALGLTRSEIATQLGMKKSPYLLELITQVLDAGYAVAEFHQNCYPPRYVYYYRSQDTDRENKTN